MGQEQEEAVEAGEPSSTAQMGVAQISATGEEDAMEWEDDDDDGDGCVQGLGRLGLAI